MVAFPDRLTAVPISDVLTPAVLSLVWRSQPGAVVQKLLEHCRQSFTGAGPGGGSSLGVAAGAGE
ncbi:hypothetical protein UG55_102440 [Frankia sp. EI5c]|uniref:hypothetical protein n=1 Tax=Frankia sp. EI5c TaxID=683316 RepID=UPI0007C28AC4|nr:hypothetical protein [Frankia sp. EI5c]OAA25219.1 hypothetical protein UG55_102440 [Frankia sp. EI5c]